MERLIEKLYHNKLVGLLFHTSVYCLKRELRDCHSVLDLGCGPDSPIKYCNVSYSIGVDAFEPYIEASKDKKVHNEYVLADITDLSFEPDSFDAVVLIEVLEHLAKEEGRALLEKVENWAKKKIVITMPNGYLPQSETSGNPYQVHRSGWTIEEVKNRGYKVYGMAGWKFLRREKIINGSQESVFSTIRFRPRLFWLIVSELTQAITYYFPKIAFEEFYVKRKRGNEKRM